MDEETGTSAIQTYLNNSYSLSSNVLIHKESVSNFEHIANITDISQEPIMFQTQR